MTGLSQAITSLINTQSNNIIKSKNYSIDLANKFMFTTDEDEKYHSYDDNPAIIYMDTNINIWMNHGVIHRDDFKPAVIFNEVHMFYKNGLLHNKIRSNAISNISNSFYWNGIKYLGPYNGRTYYSVEIEIIKRLLLINNNYYNITNKESLEEFLNSIIGFFFSIDAYEMDFNMDQFKKKDKSNNFEKYDEEGNVLIFDTKNEYTCMLNIIDEDYDSDDEEYSNKSYYKGKYNKNDYIKEILNFLETYKNNTLLNNICKINNFDKDNIFIFWEGILLGDNGYGVYYWNKILLSDIFFLNVLVL